MDRCWFDAIFPFTPPFSVAFSSSQKPSHFSAQSINIQCNNYLELAIMQTSQYLILPWQAREPGQNALRNGWKLKQRYLFSLHCLFCSPPFWLRPHDVKSLFFQSSILRRRKTIKIINWKFRFLLFCFFPILLATKLSMKSTRFRWKSFSLFVARRHRHNRTMECCEIPF